MDAENKVLRDKQVEQDELTLLCNYGNVEVTPLFLMIAPCVCLSIARCIAAFSWLLILFDRE